MTNPDDGERPAPMRTVVHCLHDDVERLVALAPVTRQASLPNTALEATHPGVAVSEWHDAIRRARKTVINVAAEYETAHTTLVDLETRIMTLEHAIAAERDAKHRVLQWSMALTVLPMAAVLLMWWFGG
jgi:hypothetical protein